MPWAQGVAHPYLIDWLDEPPLTVPGRRAVVVGCGFGDDASELARRGFEVTAFDVAPSAVDAARRRGDPRVDWQVADLLDLPDAWRGGFDLVVEVRTVQSLPGVVRDAAMSAIGTLAAPSGVVVVIGLVVADAEVAEHWHGPPWPQAPSELATYRAGGLERVSLEHRPVDEHGLIEIRATFTATGAGPGGLPSA